MVADNKNGKRNDGAARSKPAASSAESPSESAVVDALRSAYRKTIDEEVPDDFMDLLGKLT